MTPGPSAPPRASTRGEDPHALWQEYKASGDRRVRDRLVMTYAPLVKYIVFRKVRELPARCEIDDFISCGLEALIAALDRYDPEKGATLEQFLWTRVHGAVLDELRRLDWAPRSLRRWERDINRTRRQLIATSGRGPTDEELAAELELTVQELRSKEDEIAMCDVASLNAPVASDDAGLLERLDLLIERDERSDPENAVALTEAKERFRRAFAALPRREREVAVLLYVKELTLRQIGDVLGVSESRVSQIHKQLRANLHQALEHEAALFSAVA